MSCYHYELDAGGSFYNYFRDYDPSIGRYIESDPIGLEGGINTYGYALQNPIINSDPLGLEVQVCRRPVNVSWMPNSISSSVIPKHTWIKTDTKEAGMGGDCAIPGQGCADVPYVTEVYVKDHKDQHKEPNSSCETMNNVDEECVNQLLQIGQPLGTWNGFNQCQFFAWHIIVVCRTGPQI